MAWWVGDDRPGTEHPWIPAGAGTRMSVRLALLECAEALRR